MNGQTFLLTIVSGGLLAASLGYCPSPRAFVVAPDSTFQVKVTMIRDSTAECRVITHEDYGMTASCWARR
jgi:hypothetical protein